VSRDLAPAGHKYQIIKGSPSMFAFRPVLKMPAIFTALALLAQPLAAHEFKAGDVTIGHPWTRATPTGAKVAGGYLTLTNGGTKADRLIGATAEGVETIEIHEMAVVDNIMTMREVKGGLEIKPGETVEMKPASFHMMMLGLKEPFKKGQMIKGTLKFEHAGTVPIEFKVEALGAKESGGHDGHGEADKAK
jgi:copper(I)-binding protein